MSKLPIGQIDAIKQMSMTEIRELGKGGFGVVHEVITESGEHVARKTYCVAQNFSNTPETDALLKPRFLREAKLQSGISHRNVVPILKKELEEDPPYFLMPLAESTLEKDLHKDKTLGGNFLSAIMDIIAALEEIHPLKIYHRDLKPGNVLRFEDAADPRGHYYAISDFGLVALKQTQVSMLTQVGMKMTSDFYTAPEITSDLSKGSPQSDIYSIGCILHEMVGLESRIPCGEIHEGSLYGPILLSCTRKDPTRRFKSISALRDSLLEFSTQNDPMSTDSGVDMFDLLSGNKELTELEWVGVIDAIERDIKSNDATQLLRALTIDRLEEVMATYPVMASRIGRIYADWVRDGTFVFSHCDVYANRLEKIFFNSEIDLKADILMALLFLGTSHNRWYVERKFLTLLDGSEQLLLKRLAVEFRADDERVCAAIAHMEASIDFDRSSLPSILAATLKGICS